MRKLHFLAGLPRAGTSLLSAILNQHPDVFCSTGSSLIQTIRHARESYDKNPYTVSTPVGGQRAAIAHGIADGFYQHVTAPVIIDKNRFWMAPQNLRLASSMFLGPPKVLVPIRAVTDILASWLTLWENSHANGIKENVFDRDMKKFGYPDTAEGRCAYLTGPWGNVRDALVYLRDAYKGDHQDCLHLIEYDDLCDNPADVMAGIHEFLDLEPFKYDFHNVVPPVQENDDIFGMPSMHAVDKHVMRSGPDTREVLGARLYDFYRGFKIV
jgi:sulfotransferase